jgi:hypothetical protein
LNCLAKEQMLIFLAANGLTSAAIIQVILVLIYSKLSSDIL